mmetsp:Transcript_31984/g.50087  ORF Transcript_31984/g.50087 Transcript_31984/m.50087 type:complete len:197 (-) Transcript_31984:65-655(-)|eukprot:CAMPEP_0201509130 /NCGR_PEP_ID=MMETSP0161_2-20130828/2259_1 /ASSEMBLY_ACC=CAM_ASM_000251 /TAXON_ID=180227 /ORGANISM="Neoparamoeba aestuarina, Strain SoJaBio B1-5/56/2" /LENGTH=196 /DNA_ID=CAMNT_0047903983 /DNA_START=62 /DNA_END=652 /DNA_ORIENTATION=+
MAEEKKPLPAHDKALLDVYPEISYVAMNSEEIQERVGEMAKEISEAYKGKDLMLICVLKGAFLFMSDLCKKLTIPHEVDFVALSSYGTKGAKRGEVELRMDLRHAIENKHVLIVEDIIDTGHTLKKLHAMFADRKASSVKTAVLCRKKECVQVAVELDYLGFEAPNEWLVGYGLDYSERMRCLPFVACLDQEKLKK